MVSRTGIIPLAETLDTAYMARTVKDVATLFNAMIGYDDKKDDYDKGFINRWIKREKDRASFL